MKMHLSFETRDLPASVAFYRTLLANEPAKVYADYALFVCDDPGLELALETPAGTPPNGANPAPSGNGAAGNTHYGIVVATSEAVDAAIARLRRAGFPVDIETEETCCYAVQTKVWATDPDGRRWETYHVVAESDVRSDEQPACCD